MRFKDNKNMISLGKIPIPVPGVVGQVLENKNPTKTEAVIVLPDKGQIKVFNEVGARIWSLIDGVRTIEDIIYIIVNEYQIPKKVAEKDILGFMDELDKKSIIIIK